MRALTLLAVLVAAKVLVVSVGSSDWSDWVYVWQDVCVVLVFAGFDRLVRRPVWVWSAYGILASYTALNVAVVLVVSTPLTWSMVHATGAALSDSVIHHVTVGNVASIAGVLTVAAILPFLRRPAALGGRVAGGLVALGFVVIAVGASLTGRVTAASGCNAVVALIGSSAPRIAARAHRPDGDEAEGRYDWREPVETSLPQKPAVAALRCAAAGRHVVLVVLESVGASYLQPYGASLDPMPNLTRLAERSVVFRNTYAVYPESIKGLVAIQSSVHPALDSTPRQYRRPPTKALGEVLTDAGYDTALVHAGRFEYLGMADVIANAGYGARIDAAAISGNRESSFGVDETAAVDAILAFVDQPRQGPFFVSYMPVAGHHPYDSAEPGPFDGRETIGSYRNAIYSADRAIGKLFDGLRERELFDNSLIVVIGDHGQAFGQHPGNYGHTFFLFEENVRVPFLVALPGRLRESIAVATVASHVDLAPTVLDLLGISIPREYEGYSLLDARESSALMFTDYASAWLGLRRGRFKFLHEVESGRSLLFDVETDPRESADVSALHPELVQGYQEHVLRWAADRRGAIAGW